MKNAIRKIASEPQYLVEDDPQSPFQLNIEVTGIMPTYVMVSFIDIGDKDNQKLHLHYFDIELNEQILDAGIYPNAICNHLKRHLLTSDLTIQEVYIKDGEAIAYTHYFAKPIGLASAYSVGLKNDILFIDINWQGLYKSVMNSTLRIDREANYIYLTNDSFPILFAKAKDELLDYIEDAPGKIVVREEYPNGSKLCYESNLTIMN